MKILSLRVKFGTDILIGDITLLLPFYSEAPDMIEAERRIWLV